MLGEHADGRRSDVKRHWKGLHGGGQGTWYDGHSGNWGRLLSGWWGKNGRRQSRWGHWGWSLLLSFHSLSHFLKPTFGLRWCSFVTALRYRGRRLDSGLCLNPRAGSLQGCRWRGNSRWCAAHWYAVVCGFGTHIFRRFGERVVDLAAQSIYAVWLSRNWQIHFWNWVLGLEVSLALKVGREIV